MAVASARRRFRAPEVVQTSAMDCGPAALKCLLEGHGVSASLGRLREACQTDVDGTSIDALEQVAGQLGLDVEQVMLPADEVFLPESEALPALVVVKLAAGFTHFVVAWRRHGGVVQVMDPATGRRWPSLARFRDELYLHAMPIAAGAWREWAGSDDALRVLRARLARLGAGGVGKARLAAALEDPAWRSLGVLDAAVRMTEAVARAGGLRKGREAARLLDALLARAQGEPGGAAIPEAYWAVRPAPPDEETGEEQLTLRGAVLLRVRGRRAPAAGDEAEPALSPELAAALREPPRHPLRELAALLRADGALAPATLLLALALSAGGALLEALLLRGLFDLGPRLGAFAQRLGAVLALALFALVLGALDAPVAATALGMGRRLEARLRVAFLRKIPRLADRYFQSRPTSDMAERGHGVHRARALPELAARAARAALELAATTAGLLWLAPRSAPLVLALAVVAVAVPVGALPRLAERDLRLRDHAGALSRFYLDALRGAVAVRTHGAERAVRREHEALLAEWARAGLDAVRLAVRTEAWHAVACSALVAALLAHALRDGESPLLLVYWALALPAIGRRLATAAREYPAQRNAMLRLLEPLGALDEGEPEAGEREAGEDAGDHREGPGVALAFEDVTVVAGGHTVLEGVDLAIEAGCHVAVVGASGAGKSTLAGVLLGWHRAARGSVRVQGATLDAARLAWLRRRTAWVEPTVQLWNRSLLENLEYGLDGGAARALDAVVAAADLRAVLERLPDGLQTALGEGGALLSGGEAQRVRLGRAMLRPGARLVVLDEPFRGLDRERRRELLARARGLWRGATLLCITHDVGETAGFDRVLVLSEGRVVEDGAPAALAAREGSRFRALLEAEGVAREGFGASGPWRRVRLRAGSVVAAAEADA